MRKVHIVNNTFNAQISEKKWKSSLKWATINICFMSFIIFDITNTKEFNKNSSIYYTECAASFILTLSLITNAFTFIYHFWFVEKVVCENETQRMLLNLSNNSLIKAPTPKIEKPVVLPQNDVFNVRNLSYQSYSESNSMSNSFNNSFSSPIRDNTFNNDASFAETSFQTSTKFNQSNFIKDQSEMDLYLKEVSQHEKEISNAIEAQNNMTGYLGSSFNSFWGNSRFDEIIASLKTSFYQLSPHNTKQNSRDETFSSKDKENNSEIIRKMCANKLSNYVANLKMWISKTVLEPLLLAIDETDKAFTQRGFTDMKIGNVGLERLKKMASTNQHLVQHIPMLPKIIPFLELTTNQEFLVQRIRELTKGSCMKNYKFNTVSFNQSEQADHIPSDAGIVFHLFCTYLDTQLHPVPDVPRAFYSRYVVIGDVKKANVENIVKEMTKNKAKCGILCSNTITPKFNFISDKIHTSSYDRNNLFYVIIQFLMHLKLDGMLESVNLGKSGINILNIIED
ncbi:CLUMA_CG011297, isoform A [Clunio marinus]|uniref:CLUMA_CG011297, isoform A n=1 Tax=Clunio marinus TaxID=568069 RepID=A0A1J1IDT2_9DIPT|nr:CLUMA_CG011297, isoform A [Clunio marinus]